MIRQVLASLLSLLIVSSSVLAQDLTFRSQSPLVIAHTTVRDEKGLYANGLNAEDFTLLVDGKPVRFDLDYSFVPISLVLVVETCRDCGAAIKKLRKIGSLIEPLVTGERGEVAMIRYSSDVRQVQPFLRGGVGIGDSFATLKPDGEGAVLYDALAEAVQMLTPRLRGKRGVILHIGESIDRGSQRSFKETATLLEQNNILLYSVTYSRLRTAFTDKNSWKDRTEDSEFREKHPDGIMRTPPADAPYGFPDAPSPHSTGDIVNGPGNARMPGPASGPARMGDGNLGGIIALLSNAAKKNASAEFTKLTGGETIGFNRQNALEQAIAQIGEELHSQYALSFPPSTTEPERYYRLEIRLNRSGKYQVRTRPGYWMTADE